MYIYIYIMQCMVEDMHMQCTNAHEKVLVFYISHHVYSFLIAQSCFVSPCLSWEHSHVATQVMGNNYLPGSECQ